MPPERPTPDPEAPYWSSQDVANYWGVSVVTIRSYRARKRNELPPEDDKFGRSPVWRPQTIIQFERPGQGARTDLRDRDAPNDPPQPGGT